MEYKKRFVESFYTEVKEPWRAVAVITLVSVSYVLPICRTKAFQTGNKKPFVLGVQNENYLLYKADR